MFLNCSLRVNVNYRQGVVNKMVNDEIMIKLNYNNLLTI